MEEGKGGHLKSGPLGQGKRPLGFGQLRAGALWSAGARFKPVTPCSPKKFMVRI